MVTNSSQSIPVQMDLASAVTLQFAHSQGESTLILCFINAVGLSND